MAAREVAGLTARHHVGMPATLNHATIVASDFAASLQFYDAALSALGLVRAAEFGDEEESDAAVEAAGWGPADGLPVLWLVAGAEVTRGAHVALRAASRAEVEAFFAAAIDAGGRPRDAPRRWAIFRRGEFNAVVADPDGNLVEAVAGE
jgi:catechol 2,3-dioxygenase-like lactoylglutathione lyase family enzyme